MPEPDRGPLQGIVKYNPHLWGDDELRSIFVARNRELAELLDRLRHTPAGAVPQHVLVVGQRGMGKTTLLRRLALGVRDDPELSPLWIALTFPEEQFTVSTLAELWSNVLDALTDTLENEGAPQAELDRLDSEIRRIGALPSLDREDAAIGLLCDWIDQHQRRILLLIDSTDLLLDGLGGPEEGKRGQKAGAASLWRLRKTLTHHSSFFWLGASYQALESGHLYSDAFHDFFELVELCPLSVDDMRQAMLALARTFGAGQEKPGEAAAQAMARILDAKPERLKTLRNLTGGNPRTTVMLYELFAADRQDNLHADLKLLLDLMTPLYKARMENLADQPRKLLAHVMEHWAPVAAAELAEASDIPTTTVSGQLARLEAEGLIEKAKLPGRRRAGYQVAERFFNIWYLMRYTPRRIRQGLTWLVEFMRLWYSADELRALAGGRARAHAENVSDPNDPYPAANHAWLLVLMDKRTEAGEAYRQAADLAARAAKLEEGPEHWDIFLQAHLWLGNRDSARQALEQLATRASSGNNGVLYKLREQAGECHGIGLGPALAELMTQSAHASFLKPIALALRAASGEVEALDGIPPELRTMAQEVMRDILAQDRKVIGS